MRKLHDRFFKQAKREGKLARSVYKLAEMDRRHKLLRRGDRVLDLGACPGSWLEHIVEAVGPDGVACAVDLKPIHKKFKGRAHFRLGDVATLAKDAFTDVAERFDAVLSDMAPNTSGVRLVDQARSLALCEVALDWAEATLTPGGNFVCKVFDGPDAGAFRKRLEDGFAEVKMVKPEACREESFEFYLVARGYGRRKTSKTAREKGLTKARGTGINSGSPERATRRPGPSAKRSPATPRPARTPRDQAGD